VSRSISDNFLAAGALVGVVAAGYVAYLVWTMNWGTGSRNMALGTTFLIILPVVAFGACLLVFALIGAWLEGVMARRGR
jgi:hypothetical protein